MVRERVDIFRILLLNLLGYLIMEMLAPARQQVAVKHLLDQAMRKTVDFLAVVFDDTTTIGMVRLYLAEAASTLTTIFQRIAGRLAANS